MDFHEALAYLDEHTSYRQDRADRLAFGSTDRGDLLGDWETRTMAAPVIHVTGTNGKGSTVQMISRLLGSSGPDGRDVHEPSPRAMSPSGFKRNGERITRTRSSRSRSALLLKLLRC